MGEVATMKKAGAVGGKAAKKTPAYKPSFQLIKGAVEIKAGIVSMAGRYKKADMFLHKVACSILAHIDAHHEVSLANHLLENMPKSVRSVAMIEWVLAYGKCVWDDEEQKFVHASQKATLLKEAMLKPFWDFKPPEKYRPVDLNAEIARVLKKAAERATSDKRTDKDQIDTAKLKAFAELAAFDLTPFHLEV